MYLKVERLPVDGDGKCGIVLVVDPNDSSPQPDTSPPHALQHLLLAGVVGEESGRLVEDEPPILPALHHVRPF